MTRSMLRRVLGLVAMLACVLATGCGRDDKAAVSPAEGPRLAAPAPEVAAPEFPLTVTDARDVEVTFDAEPQRIVSMSPPLTETLFALGLAERVVGVTRFCEYPPEATEKEQIGGVSDPSLEKIVSLEADVVFAALGNPMPVIDSLEESGVTVFAVNPETYDEVAESIRAMGDICGASEKAASIAGGFGAAAKEIADRTEGIAEEDRPSALFIVWLDPLHVAGPGTYIDDMLKLCGVRNAAGKTDNPWKQFSLEMAIAADPEILILTKNHTAGVEDVAELLAELRENESWNGVSAVTSGRIVVVESNLVLRTGPRLVDGLRELAHGIDPELHPRKAEASAPSHASH